MSDIDLIPQELKPSQVEVLNDIFKYQDDGEITEQEVELLAKAFERPEVLVTLRKALRLLTPNEKGLFLSTPDDSLSGEDYAEIGKEYILTRKADERIRVGIVNLFLLIQKKLKDDKKAEFEAFNVKEFKRKQEEEKETEEKKLVHSVGVNL